MVSTVTVPPSFSRREIAVSSARRSYGFVRVSPDIRFMADETFDEVVRIDEILRSPKVVQDLKKT